MFPHVHRQKNRAGNPAESADFNRLEDTILAALRGQAVQDQEMDEEATGSLENLLGKTEKWPLTIQWGGMYIIL
jgi:hypothetical protein